MTDRDRWVGLGNDCNLGRPHKHHWKTCQSMCTTRQATFPTRRFSKEFSRDIFKTLDRLSIQTTSCDYSFHGNFSRLLFAATHGPKPKTPTDT